MRLYPELAAQRNRQITRDVLVGLALLLFALFAWAVHSAVMSLTAISEGFTDNAQGAVDAWGSVGAALGGIPLVGDDIQGAVAGLSDATFGSAVATGQSVTDAVTLAAGVLAFVTFAAPAAVVGVLWLPRRLDRARAWDAAERALSPLAVPPGSAPGVGVRASGSSISAPPDELLALRALCHLPLVDLVGFAPRPFEAYAAGDHAPLVAALYAHEGRNPPGWSVRA